MSDKSHSEHEAIGSLPPGKPLGEGNAADVPPDAGPTGPASVEGETKGPETGGYDDRTPHPATDNRKGGYGAG